MLKKWFYRLVFGLGASLTAAALLVGPALAGGVVVALDSPPPDVPPGTPFSVGFTIHSAHDGSAQNKMEPTITLTNAATGETVLVNAAPSGEAGHYTAEITLPSAGQWEWEIQPLGKYAENYPASVMTPIQVTQAEVAAASGAARSQLPAQLPGISLLLLAASAVILLAALAVRLGQRRRQSAR